MLTSPNKSSAMQRSKCSPQTPSNTSLQQKRRAHHSRAIKIDRLSRALPIQINISMRSSQLPNLIAAKISNGAVHILRVGDELRARCEDLVGDADGRAGEDVVEVYDTAIEGSCNGCVRTGLVVDEGDGDCGWCCSTLWSWESEGSGCEEGRDGGDGELHVGCGVVIEF